MSARAQFMLRKVALAAVLAVWAGVSWNALAAPRQEGHAVQVRAFRRDQPRREDLITPREAVERARRVYPGRVLSVELFRRGGEPFYRVKIFSGGHVRVVDVPARR